MVLSHHVRCVHGAQVEARRCDAEEAEVTAAGGEGEGVTVLNGENVLNGTNDNGAVGTAKDGDEPSGGRERRGEREIKERDKGER